MKLLIEKKTEFGEGVWYYVSATDGDDYKCLLATRDEEKANRKYEELLASLTPETKMITKEIIKSTEL